MITYNDFQKLKLRIATIKHAEKIEGSNKLLKLQVDICEKQPRQIIAGIAQTHQPQDLIDTQIVVLVNLEPKKLMGIESQGMLLATADEEKIILLRPETHAQTGATIS